MTPIPDRIIALALLAIDDPDAVQVLEDAMEEDGRDWGFAVYAWDPKTQRMWAIHPLLPVPSACGRAANPLAITTIGLFQCWSTEMWPVARRCLVGVWVPGWWGRGLRHPSPPVVGDPLFDDDPHGPLTGEGDVEH